MSTRGRWRKATAPADRTKRIQDLIESLGGQAAFARELWGADAPAHKSMVSKWFHGRDMSYDQLELVTTVTRRTSDWILWGREPAIAPLQSSDAAPHAIRQSSAIRAAQAEKQVQAFAWDVIDPFLGHLFGIYGRPRRPWLASLRNKFGIYREWRDDYTKIAQEVLDAAQRDFVRHFRRHLLWLVEDVVEKHVLHATRRAPLRIPGGPRRGGKGASSGAAEGGHARKRDSGRLIRRLMSEGRA